MYRFVYGCRLFLIAFVTVLWIIAANKDDVLIGRVQNRFNYHPGTSPQVTLAWRWSSCHDLPPAPTAEHGYLPTAVRYDAFFRSLARSLFHVVHKPSSS